MIRLASIARAASVLLLAFLAVGLPLGADSAAVPGLGRAVVTGVIKDDTGSPIPGVTVVVTREGESGDGARVAVSGGEGEFRIDGLEPGPYAVEAALDGFQPVRADARLVTGQALQLAFKMVPAFGETVEVVAEAARTGEVAVLESRRQSAVVSDSISAEEIRRTPDSSAAGVVERLTGVTLLGDKYVFVRGLGERYSGTTVNGATLPTTETEKRVVPLDLFPAKLLESVNVLKTYTPDKPGDFGSGVVEMTTTQFPGEASLKLTLGSSYQAGATGNDFRQYAGGLSRLGDGGQARPAALPDAPLRRKSALDPTGFSPEELEVIGEAFVGDWTGGEPTTASPGTDFALTYGNTLGRMGVVLSAVSNHKFDNTDEVQRFFGLDAGDVLVPRNDYDMTTDKESATTGFVGNLSFRLADGHQLHLNTMLTRDASAENRFQEGLNTNTGGLIRDYRVRYQQEEILTSRLRGEHTLGGGGIGSLLEWSVARSMATNESDLRENLYRESDEGEYALQVGYPESGKMDFFDLEDEVEQGGLSYTFFYANAGGNRSGALKAGFDHMNRTRDFGARRFRFTTPNQLQFDLTATPEEIFTAENIRANGFEIREITGVNDAYDAEHTVDAGYLMADSTFGRWRVITGARYEDSEQGVTTFNPFDTSSEVVSINRSRDVLPSLNAVWQATPETNIRFAYGRSLNRPEFRELSPFTFVEVTGGRSVVGNPDLEQATLDSFDVRWERFPAAGEVIAISAFYKMIDKPIERIVQPTTELRTSFVNAKSAELRGLELEYRRSLASMHSALRWFGINANYAWIESDVTVGDQQLSVVTNSSRPLEGQSDQVANLALQFYRPEWGTMVRLLGSFNGERLTDVGAFGLPDIYESASSSLDLVLSQTLSNLLPGVELKLAGSNLLDQAREYTQGGELQRRYEPGRSFSLSISYTPFQ